MSRIFSSNNERIDARGLCKGILPKGGEVTYFEKFQWKQRLYYLRFQWRYDDKVPPLPLRETPLGDPLAW
jgi:hypothetical protein